MLFVAVFVTCALLAPSTPRPSPAPGRPRVVQRSAGDLYSLRARRRFASYLRLRLLELREAGLERAAKAIERRVPVEDLLPKR
ncbi:MAG TPA: hypothetical protein VKG44_03520 [Candidatus Baltobacteraceae bacterium]|nr:hypothetical protein [Candidatus Baltobacteraceae bacterium]